MKKFIKEYFNYSKSERRGLLVLIVLIVGVFIVPVILNSKKNSNTLNIADFESQLNHFEPTQVKPDNKTHTVSTKYFNFDPNTISKKGLIKLGLSKQQAQTLINYRKAGGVFEKPTDLKKIYSIDNRMYKSLYPFIKIKNIIVNDAIVDSELLKNHKPKTESPISNKPVLLVELNTADSVDLIKLNGIGNILAKRITSYRNFLGGYYKKEQLLEVYGLKNETYKSINKLVCIDTAHIQKMDLNTIEFKLLNKHPYITFANTKAILKYRKLMGGFKSMSELIENHLVDSTTYNKIKHYIRVD